MAIAERINYFRNKCGMTMKHLGQRLGYAEKSADVRVAQYESGNRKPKEDTIHALAEIFDVAPAALDVPDIDSYIGIMHTLFKMDDGRFQKVANVVGECMKYHPHGDASIGGALVVLANKGIFIEKQSGKDFDRPQYLSLTGMVLSFTVSGLPARFRKPVRRT